MISRGHPALRAAGWMAVSIASFVLMAVAARQLSGHMAPVEILFVRSAVSLLILVLLRPRLGVGAFATRRLGLHIVRNIIHFAGQYAWVWGIAFAPLAVVTAIEFTTPVWVALLATALLREHLPPPRLVAVAAGIVGVLIIVRPGASAFGPAALIILAGAFCFAAAILFVKALLRTDSVTAVVFYMSVIQLPMGLAGSLFVWVRPLISDIPWLAAMGATALSAHYAVGRALALGDASFVLPIDFLRLPVVGLTALLLYGEGLDEWTMLGAALICGGNYWSVRHEARAIGPAASGDIRA
jgi:drug/metabolite transporter (DMT)-like permease